MMAYVTEQIHILKDLCVLPRKDPREKELRSLLSDKSEIQIENMLHDLKCGFITLDKFLERHGA